MPKNPAELSVLQIICCSLRRRVFLVLPAIIISSLTILRIVGAGPVPMGACLGALVVFTVIGVLFLLEANDFLSTLDLDVYIRDALGRANERRLYRETIDALRTDGPLPVRLGLSECGRVVLEGTLCPFSPFREVRVQKAQRESEVRRAHNKEFNDKASKLLDSLS